MSLETAVFDWNEVIRLATVAGVVWSASWFLSNKQDHIYKKMEEIKQTILDKLEYHERHDDARFEGVRKEIYQLGLRVASGKV